MVVLVPLKLVTSGDNEDTEDGGVDVIVLLELLFCFRFSFGIKFPF